MDMTSCPECGHPAEIQWRDVLESTDGPVEHARVTCVERHHFFLPVAGLAPSPPVPEGPARRRNPSACGPVEKVSGPATGEAVERHRTLYPGCAKVQPPATAAARRYPTSERTPRCR
jgi:hypothetical protein